MSSEQIVVCTPTYHRIEPLKLAVESVRQQTHQNFQHIVVKDGCVEGPDCRRCRETDELGNRLSREDSRLKYISLKEHQGGYGYYARNHGIEISTAPLIAYLDDDNWWEPNHLETLYAAITRAKATFAFSGTRVYTATGKLLFNRITRKPYFSGIDTNELLHRRELIAKYGPWKPTDAIKHNHDWELVCRWMQGHEPYVSTGLATSDYKLNAKDPELLFWYSYFKHRILRMFTTVLISDARYYRAETLAHKP
jgi:glycosyltransferase involved in cell wall biosynthesis